MTTRTTCLRQEPRASLVNPATMIVVAMITAMTFAASGAAPTPLYHLYQQHFGLTPALVTVIFAAYVLSLLLALLTTGTRMESSSGLADRITKVSSVPAL